MKQDLSPKTYRILLIVNVVVCVCALVIGVFDVYYSDWIPAACMLIIFVASVYNIYSFYNKLK